MEIELEKVGIDRSGKIISISSLNPLVAFVNESVFDVCRKMSCSLHRSIPVVDKKFNLKGIVTITDIFNLFLSEWKISLPIEIIMSKEVVSCEENETIEYVLQKMRISKKGRLPVLSFNKVVGIVSETDFILSIKKFEFLEGIRINEVMVKKPFFISQTFTIKDVMRTMVNTKYRRLPVVENGKLVGYITSTLLFKTLVENSFSSIFLSKRVSEVMVRNPITAKKSDSLGNVLQKMREKKISSMLIVSEDNKLEGIFTERDFINLLV
jgi:CBS domain-containing protein